MIFPKCGHDYYGGKDGWCQNCINANRDTKKLDLSVKARKKARELAYSRKLKGVVVGPHVIYRDGKWKHPSESCSDAWGAFEEATVFKTLGIAKRDMKAMKNQGVIMAKKATAEETLAAHKNKESVPC